HYGGLLRAVKWIGNEHDIAFGSQSPTHVAESWAQAHDIGPHQHGWKLASLVRREEYRIGRTIRSFYRNVLLSDRSRRKRGARRTGRCSSNQAERPPRHARVLDQSRMDELVTHALSPCEVGRCSTTWPEVQLSCWSRYPSPRMYARRDRAPADRGRAFLYRTRKPVPERLRWE